jgi:hypothetical protein
MQASYIVSLVLTHPNKMASLSANTVILSKLGLHFWPTASYLYGIGMELFSVLVTS